MSPPIILSERLQLIPLSAAFLEVSLAGDLSEAERLLGLPVPSDWLEARSTMRRRLSQLREDPSLEPWLLRAVVERTSGGMVGHAGFHTAPGPEYLEPYAPGGLEIGYTIYPEHRRQGYAREACGALMEWAAREAGVRLFVLSISPQNEPSLRIASYYGFRKVSQHIDDEDGPEEILVREWMPE